MAERFYYYTENGSVRKRRAEFTWYSGFALSQKQKSIDSFHTEIKRQGRNPLEISTKSAVPLGVKLSAFNLELDGHLLECVFQSSKVFEKGGPFADLLEVSPKDAKRDERIKFSGKLTGFQYQGEDWPLEPKTVFYDWLYYNAVRSTFSNEELEELAQYDAFTDIEFNANKSLNTQARSAALVVLLFKQYKKLPALTKTDFLDLHRQLVKG